MIFILKLNSINHYRIKQLVNITIIIVIIIVVLCFP
jgi:hypothetical protein